MTKNRVFSSFIWSVSERFGAQFIGIVVNILLARLLNPEDFGILAIMVIFTNLANQLVQNGFNTSLIQNKDVTDEDYSSVFNVSMLITLGVYLVIYAVAPIIADFYNSPGLVKPLRVLALIVFPGTIQSVQTAKLKRNLEFKKLFVLTLISSITGGGVGIFLAFRGSGVWALVGQQLIGSISTCIVLFYALKWKPHIVINFQRIKILFSYGWKLLVASLLNTVYNDITGLVIGKKYNTSMLAYYDKGQMFPSRMVTSINDSIQNVMLPALSQYQDEREKCKELMRQSVKVSCYVIFPLMAGLAAVANPLVSAILTDKWLACVPFLQLACINYAFNPIASANLQAMKAMGRSDIFLKLEIIKKVIGMIVLVITVFCFESPLAIVAGTTATIPLGLFINAYPNKRIVGYSFSEQMKDILPSLLLSLQMFAIVYVVSYIHLNNIILLIVQMGVGAAVYIVSSKIFHVESFDLLLNIIKSYLKK